MDNEKSSFTTTDQQNSPVAIGTEDSPIMPNGLDTFECSWDRLDQQARDDEQSTALDSDSAAKLAWERTKVAITDEGQLANGTYNFNAKGNLSSTHSRQLRANV
ncbi:hypothetical protein J7T55_013804 [Diaporthe amygdali]|uniref:uncharacterized protein n=1 Tax=Phomopsis amygdali TaxID=1214568 RepID=UPI0022FE08D1|nr:uncharacterized protein J7T55_013804 [Diaporthe amygdali]KAJ0119601.1 hypothetical protein J7T55_013804 [Diaporthe amygdali]